MSNYEIALCLGVLSPLVMFVILAFFGARISKPASGWCAVFAVVVSFALATFVAVGWLGHTPEGRAELSKAVYAFEWVNLTVAGQAVPIIFKVKLDSLTVMMYLMVTLVSTCIFVFSVGYMAGHSDEVDGQSKYHRFFCYLCLFEFSMLGLLISSSLFFLFVFWELVGLCSYLLIGFYFDKKFATNAGMKAFITNRVGDFGFLLGLMLVFVFLRTLDLDEAAAVFRHQYETGTGIFAAVVSIFGYQLTGMNLATLMGIGLFCGAMGKSAQFPLQVWLPDAMAGPTPVSALIHAATMVAAGVYLVARIFRLLTPDAQMFIAVIGCITLTITALIAIVQTDIKKVLAYSTLSQLGYMIFGLGVGAWVAALFHLITHAFFKAMLFLGSGQVIEGCHHVQDMRKMGGLHKKMPFTCWTFFVGVLAISGFGLPGFEIGGHKIGLGGFFSKDEILAVAYERTFNWEDRFGGTHEGEGGEHGGEGGAGGGSHAKHARAETLASSPFVLTSGGEDHSKNGHGANDHGANEHGSTEHGNAGGSNVEHGSAGHGGGGHGSGGHGDDPAKAAIARNVPVLPKILFWLPIIIAYITPFYMMRCWWLTFMGKPRDEHVHAHAHESKLMWAPLVVLAIGTCVVSYYGFRENFAETGIVAANAPLIVAIDGEGATPEPHMLGLTHTEGHNPHEALVGIVGFAWIIGMGFAVLIYRRGFGLSSRLRQVWPLNWIYIALDQKLFFDHIYNTVLVGGTKWVLAQSCRLFDTYIVDGFANFLGRLVVRLAGFSGQVADAGLVDGFVEGLAESAKGMGQLARQPQTGRIRNYVLFGTAGATLVILALLMVVYMGAKS